MSLMKSDIASPYSKYVLISNRIDNYTNKSITNDSAVSNAGDIIIIILLTSHEEIHYLVKSLDMLLDFGYYLLKIEASYQSHIL